MNNFLRSGFPFPQSSPTQDYIEDMKVPPIQLPNGMDRLPLPLPFSPDLLWRYPNPFMAQPPPSPLESHVKSGLPGNWNDQSTSEKRRNDLTFGFLLCYESSFNPLMKGGSCEFRINWGLVQIRNNLSLTGSTQEKI